MKFCFKGVAKGFIIDQERLKKNKLILSKMMIKILRPTSINPNGEFISKRFIDWLVQNKFLIMAYTVNTKTLKSKLKRMGITIFFTDNHSFYSNKSFKPEITEQPIKESLV